MVTVNVVSPDTQQQAAPAAEPVVVIAPPPPTPDAPPNAPAPADTPPPVESVADSDAENAAVISGSFDEPEAEAMLRDLGQDPGPAESADAPDAAAVLFSESPDAADSEPIPAAPTSEPEPVPAPASEPVPEPNASNGSDDADAAAMMHDLGNDMPPESDPVPESAIQDPTPDTGFGEEASTASDSDNEAVSEMMDAQNATHGSLSAFEEANKEEDVDLENEDIVPEGMEDAPSVMDLINKIRQPKEQTPEPPPQEAQASQGEPEDGDEDGDGIPDMIDPSSNPDVDYSQTDTDGDGIPDAQDPNPMVPTSAQDAQSGPQRGPIDLSDVPRAESGKTGLLDGIMGTGTVTGTRTAEGRALARGAVDQGGGRFGNFVQHGANRQKRGRGRRELSASRR